MLNIRKIHILTGDLPANFAPLADGQFYFREMGDCVVVFRDAMETAGGAELTEEIRKAFADNPECQELQLFPR